RGSEVLNILYFGKVCEDEIFFEKEKKKQPFFIAQYTFEKALCKEIESYKEINLEINSIFQTEYFPNDKLFINKNSNQLKYFYLPYLNLPFLREIFFFIMTCIRIIKWKIKYNNKDSLIYSSNHYPPVSLAIIIIGTILKI